MDTLEMIYQSCLSSTLYKTNVPKNVLQDVELIGKNCNKQKGLYTVLVTLLYYKYLHPEQDIRYHQAQLPNGFSGRSFDTNYVTPVLEKLGLPAMAESGWLTRSLEQPYPYTKDYSGKISSGLRDPFLNTLDYIQKNPDKAIDLLRFLLRTVDEIVKEYQVTIIPLENPEKISIASIMSALEEHFLCKYATHNGAKLPILAFHSIYTILISEMERYKNSKLADLSSLTACDRTNKASGDIEIFKNNKVFESIEIKLDRKINSQILRVARDKIYKWNPARYYILSVFGIEESEKEEIYSIVEEVEKNHGCQIIINGLLPTIKYYLRLITDLKEFISLYSMAVQNDKELQKVHKLKWNELIEKYLS